MGQPVRLSEALVLDARITGELEERSIAGQIEHWASLGRIVDSLMRGKDALEWKKRPVPKSLEECLAEVETPAGRQSVKDFLRTGPFPRYEAAKGKPGWLLRTEESGKQTVGRFVHRKFVEYSDDV